MKTQVQCENHMRNIKTVVGNLFPSLKLSIKRDDRFFQRSIRFLFKIEKSYEARNHDLDSIYIMRERVVSEGEWRVLTAGLNPKEIKLDELYSIIDLKTNKAMEKPPRDNYIASILISLYKSEEYIATLLKNVLEQSVFHQCEVQIISIDPTPSELDLLIKFDSAFKNVNLEISDERISIYDAWNRMIKNSTAQFITNMNADDLRSKDSILLQSEYLNRNPWVDLVYQDFFYAREHGFSWEDLTKVNARSNLSTVSLYSLVVNGINPPHNSPMWRRSLHDSFGYFSESFKSAGDIDFWIRCRLGGAVFLKMREIHSSYFLNPAGMSTSTDSPGMVESREIILQSIEVFKQALNVDTDSVNLLDPYFYLKFREGLRKKLNLDLVALGIHDDN